MKKFFFFLFIFILGGLVTYLLTNHAQSIKTQNLYKVDSSGSDLTVKQSSTKVKNIILLIGDGMGLAQVSAGMAANQGKLHIERCTFTGLSKTSSANKYITDSAAAGTAMSSGVKTNNGMIAVTPDGKHTTTILELAEGKGMSTGLISTSTITHATPASFIAHQVDRSDYEAIAADFLKTDVDVVIGGGRNNFAVREDQQNLVEKLTANGYTVLNDIQEVIQSDASKLYGLCATEHLPSKPEGRGDFLNQAIGTAIAKLSENENGFFLMAEASQIDWGGHANDAEYIISEMLDFDQAIGTAIDFAQEDGETLVIVTADHETGGLSITNAAEEEGEISLEFSTLGHTPIMIPVYAFGPHAEFMSGIYENTAIFHKMTAALKLQHTQVETP